MLQELEHLIANAFFNAVKNFHHHWAKTHSQLCDWTFFWSPDWTLSFKNYCHIHINMILELKSN